MSKLIGQSETRVKAARKVWVSPSLRVMNAGSAENAVTPNLDNGINVS